MHFESWPEFERLVTTAVQKATAIKQARIDGVPLTEESLTEIKSTINTIQRKMAGLSARAEEMANQGRLDDLQSQPSQHGQTLLRVGHYNIDAIRPGLAQKIRKVGREWHLVETMPVYCDGGVSVQAIVDRIRKNSEELAEIVKAVNEKS
jgi:hypothetical protein